MGGSADWWASWRVRRSSSTRPSNGAARKSRRRCGYVSGPSPRSAAPRRWMPIAPSLTAIGAPLRRGRSPSSLPRHQISPEIEGSPAPWAPTRVARPGAPRSPAGGARHPLPPSRPVRAGPRRPLPPAGQGDRAPAVEGGQGTTPSGEDAPLLHPLVLHEPLESLLGAPSHPGIVHVLTWLRPGGPQEGPHEGNRLELPAAVGLGHRALVLAHEV